MEALNYIKLFEIIFSRSNINTAYYVPSESCKQTTENLREYYGEYIRKFNSNVKFIDPNTTIKNNNSNFKDSAYYIRVVMCVLRDARDHLPDIIGDLIKSGKEVSLRDLTEVTRSILSFIISETSLLESYNAPGG